LEVNPELSVAFIEESIEFQIKARVFPWSNGSEGAIVKLDPGGQSKRQVN